MTIYMATIIVFLCLIKGTIGQIPCPVREEIVFFKADLIPPPPTFFRLYTRKNSYYPHYLTDKKSFDNSNFNPYLKTVIILHGWMETPNMEHVMVLKSSYLSYEDCNIIVVNWAKGAAPFYFPFAMRNTLSEGKYIAGKLEIWKNYVGLDFSKIHIIGFSIGSHIAGFIGKYVRTGKIRRITGLDVAGVCFKSFSPKYKLHYSDAHFVDVITTTGTMKQPTGHVHFRPDGGKVSRGCADRLADLIGFNLPYVKFLLLLRLHRCTHKRSAYLFATSLHSKILPVAYKCKDRETFNRGKCSECGADGKKCAALGIHAEKYADKIINGTVNMFLATTFTEGYFLYHYHVEVSLASRPYHIIQTGKILLIINSGLVKTTLNKDFYARFVRNIFLPGKTYVYLMTTTRNIYPITKLQFLWYANLPDRNSRLYIRCIKIVPMNNLQRDRSHLTTYGSTKEPILPDQIVTLNLGKSC